MDEPILLPILPKPDKPPKRGRGGRPDKPDADGLTTRQRMSVEALLQEPTIRKAAVLAGVNERTLRRWMGTPVFQRAYHGCRRAAFGQAVGLMQKYSPVAVTTLVQVMTDPKAQPSARVAAAATLLRFGREGIELDDLAQRIETLEAETIDRKKRLIDAEGWSK